MPLRDHFRPPVWKKASWEGFHGMWPGMIVLQLTPKLPEGFTAEPRVHLGTFYEIDVCAFDSDEPPPAVPFREASGGAATAIATWAPPQPTFVAEFDPTEQYAYEVLVFDRERERELVAAIEIVSPANKDRSDHRRKFTAKCAALLQQKVCVSIVDLVTIRKHNLYAEVLELMGQKDPTLSPLPSTYAATCRSRRAIDEAGREGSVFETWTFPLVVGQPLPTLPIWLSEDLAVSLDLEASYEEACRALRIS
jgi:uncharacterized protein DUF4058